MIKLIACDLDGTLLDGAHQLPIENAEAIKKIQKAGILFMVATGRNYKSVIPMLDEHEIRCDCLLLNGALITDEQGRVQHDWKMSKELVKKAISVLEEEKACYHIYGEEGTITTNAEKGIREFSKHMVRQGLKKEEIEHMLKTTSFATYDREVTDIASYLMQDPTIYKIEAFGEDTQQLQQLRKRLGELDHIAITNSVADNVEITEDSAQKGVSLLHFCALQGIRKEEVIVIGDSLNDLSMMEIFPHSVAVANAMDEIREAATHITKSNIEFGVRDVLEGVLGLLETA